MNIWYLCVLQLGSNWPLDTWPCWVFFMVAIVMSIPFWTRLLHLSKVQRAVVFGGLHDFWDISVIFWTSKVDCCCCFMIISYPCVFGWLISSWLKCGDSKWLIFRAAKLGPDLRYRTIIAIEIGDLSWIYPLKMVIFHSYVRLPEGNSSIISISFEGWRRWQ